MDVAHTTAAKHDLSRTLTQLIRAVVLDDRPVKAVGLQQRLKYLVHAEIVCVTGVLIVRVDRSAPARASFTVGISESIPSWYL